VIFLDEFFFFSVVYGVGVDFFFEGGRDPESCVHKEDILSIMRKLQTNLFCISHFTELLFLNDI